MLPYFSERWGNASSLHAAGQQARAAVETAREQVASLIGAEDPEEIVFTAGATEANNWILRSNPEALISPFEHSSLFETARALGNDILENEAFEVAIPVGAELVSLMKVNNEIGTIFQPEEIAGPAVHSDITQAVGKIPVSVSSLDFASFSAHKFYGPKGVGALYARGGLFPTPLIYGGEQEHDNRAGTLNVAGIVGMGAAAELAKQRLQEDYAHGQGVRQAVLENLQVDHCVNGGMSVSPYILSVSFPGIEGETLVLEMDRLGFAISSGAACSAGSVEPSHVLTALGIEPEWLRGTVRISFGRSNTLEAARELGRELTNTVMQLRNMGGGGERGKGRG